MLFLLFNNPITVQVFGGDFYIKFDRTNYILTGYGIDNDKIENNKEIVFEKKELRNVFYNKIKFISFQDTTQSREKQFYETIILRLQCKRDHNKEMLISITGLFVDTSNYVFNINFKAGAYFVFIPTSEKEQSKLTQTDLVRGGTDITNLLIKM